MATFHSKFSPGSRSRRFCGGSSKPVLIYKPTDFRRYIIEKRLKTLREYSLFTRRSIRVQPRETLERCALSVGSHNAGSNIDVLRLAIQDLGFNEVTDEQERDITWNSAFFMLKDKARGGHVNKFPGSHFIVNKINLFKCLEFQRNLFPEAYNFYPKTWILPHQFDEWSSYTNSHAAKGQTYIVKPSIGTQGKGIYLVQSPGDYCRERLALLCTQNTTGQDDRSPDNGGAFEDSDTTDIDPALCLSADTMGFRPATEVLQVYEDAPALVNGYKADLRIYVVLESIKPLRIHVYRDGLVRLASQRYHIPEPGNLRNSKMHLTNYSINKFPDSVDPALRCPSDASTNHSGNGGGDAKAAWQCKRRLHHLLQPGSSSSRLEVGWSLHPGVFWAQVDDLVRNTIFALLPSLKIATWAALECEAEKDSKSPHQAYTSCHKTKETPQCFQIFGFDLLLVGPDSKPVLLEVNSSPSLRIDCMRPLVRYASAATRQGLCPEVVVNSPKYSAFYRSRVDEAVKLGLMKATLLLIGSRVIHQKLVRFSPDKAQTFLELCGYVVPSAETERHREEPDEEEEADKVRRKQGTGGKTGNPEELASSSQCNTTSNSHSRRSIRGGGSSGWMSARISRIYCRPSRGSRESSNSANTSSTMATSSLRRGRLTPSSAGFGATVPVLSAPAWPPLRCPSTNMAGGRQRQIEKLSEYFITHPLSQSCRKARNRLQCIYAEDDIYPTSSGIFAENDKESAFHATTGSEKMSGSQHFSNLHSSDPKKSPLFAEHMEKLSIEGKPMVQDRSRSNSHNPHFEACRPILPPPAYLYQIRCVDQLAEVFIKVLSTRRPPPGQFRPPEMPDNQNQATQPPTIPSRTQPTRHQRGQFLIFLEQSNMRGVSQEKSIEPGHVVDVPVPRMDFTAFRIFTQRCKLRSCGIPIREIDILFMKHKLYWYRVFETDAIGADQGLSFPAFVELCGMIAQNYYKRSTAISKSGEPSEQPKTRDASPRNTAEERRSRFVAFVEHCVNALKPPTSGTPTSPFLEKVTPKSLQGN